MTTVHSKVGDQMLKKAKKKPKKLLTTYPSFTYSGEMS